MPGQQIKQIELPGGEADLLAIHLHLPGVGIDDQPIESKGRLTARGRASARALGASQHRPHPTHQLARAEGLDHIIIRAHLEAQHPIHLLAPRREHDDGHIATHPQPASDLQSIHARQHQVQHHQIRRLPGQIIERGLPIRQQGDAIARPFQIKPGDLGDAWFVFDNENVSVLRHGKLQVKVVSVSVFFSGPASLREISS